MPNAKEDQNVDSVNALTINYEEEGVLLVKQLKKEILSKGAWTTILYLFQEYDRGSRSYRAPKISLRRYQKKGGNYIQRSKFTLSSQKQALAICEKIKDWCLTGQVGGAEAGDEET